MKLVYYDLNGQVKESKSVDYMIDYSYLWFGDIISLGDYFYIVSSSSKKIDGNWKNVLTITKYDEKLMEVASKNIVPEREIVRISSIDMLFSVYDNELYVYYGEDNKQMAKVNTDLTDVESIEVNDTNLERYFPNKYLEKQNIQDDLSFSSSDVSVNKQVLAGSIYNEEEEKNKAYLYIKNGTKEVTKINDSYTNFYSSVIMGDYVFVLAQTNILIHTNKDESSTYDEREMYKSEILVYDLEGNIVDQKGQQENSTFLNVDVVDKKILVSRLYSDGICDYVERTTSGFTTPEKRYENCDSRFSNYVYEFKAKEPEIQNPETGAFLAMTTAFVAILVGALIVIKNKSRILKV